MSNWKHCRDQQKGDYFVFISKASGLETIPIIYCKSVTLCCLVWSHTSTVKFILRFLRYAQVKTVPYFYSRFQLEMQLCNADAPWMHVLEKLIISHCLTSGSSDVLNPSHKLHRGKQIFSWLPPNPLSIRVACLFDVILFSLRYGANFMMA